MSRIELLLVQLDEAYGRLSRRLEGLTDEEYLWQPVPGGWSIRRAEDGRWAADYGFPDPVPAPFTTIAWRLLHIADCKIMYHEYAYGASTLTFPDMEAPRTAAGALARLTEGQRLLREDLTGLADDAALDAEVGTNWGGQLSQQAEPDHAHGGGQTWPAWRIFSDDDRARCLARRRDRHDARLVPPALDDPGARNRPALTSRCGIGWRF